MASQTSKEPTASGSGSLGNVHSFSEFGWPFTPNHKSSEPFSTTRKAIDRALEGDSVALRLCLERIVPPRRDRPISFRLPPIQAAADAAKAMAAILERARAVRETAK
jgi:hypothetical protein